MYKEPCKGQITQTKEVPNDLIFLQKQDVYIEYKKMLNIINPFLLSRVLLCYDPLIIEIYLRKYIYKTVYKHS